jgi:hypothetical protein
MSKPDQSNTSTARTIARRVSGVLSKLFERAIESLMEQGVYLLLLVAIAFNLYFLLPEVTVDAPPLNDNVLHVTNLSRAIGALITHQDVTDHWLANIALGYPLFHYYQHLPYVIPALVEWLALAWLRVAPAPTVLLNWITYLMLSLFPLSIYWSMRRFGFARTPAALGALCSSLLSTNGLYGFDFNSYVWSGYGLYTQLWGMFLLPPALAQCHIALKEGRGYFLAGLLLSALLLSHLMLGYVALGSLILIALVVALDGARTPSHRIWPTVRRLALLLILAALVTAYLFIPLVLDDAYMNRSVWELAGKYDAYGWQWTLAAFVAGQLFDFGRLPVLTLLVAVGLLVCARGWREERYRIPVVLFVAWLLLYFGRPTWGALLNLLPLSNDLQLHRFIAGIHLAGIFLIGIGLAAVWEWAQATRRAPVLLALVSVATLFLLAPAYAERSNYLEKNALWKSQTGQASAAEDKDLAALFNTLRDLPPGRVYAGLGNNWGKDYRVGAAPMYSRLQLEGFDLVGYAYHALAFNADIQVLFDDSSIEQYNLFNIRYVVTPADYAIPPFYKPLQTFGRHRLYQIETTGYFDLVDSDPSLIRQKQDWFPAASAWLTSTLPTNKLYPAIRLSSTADDPQNARPLAQAPTLITQLPTNTFTSAGRIVSETLGSNSYNANVEVQRASTLMLKVTYHPNWHAYMDGVETPTTMLMPSYLGVPITSGQHRVWLEYRPQAYHAYLQLLGFMMLLLLGVAEWRPDWLAAVAARLKLGRISA